MKISSFIKIFLFLLFTYSGLMASQEGNNSMVFYYGHGCVHCVKVEKFVHDKGLAISMVKKEIYQNSTNAEEFNALCDAHNIALLDRTVPLLHVEWQCILRDENIIHYLEGQYINKTAIHETPSAPQIAVSQKLTLPILVGAAIVDAINPCAFAVLLILMTTILVTQTRRRAIYTGLAFSLSIFISYLNGIGTLFRSNAI